MQLFLLILSTLLIINVVSNCTPRLRMNKKFIQRLDHFDPYNNEIWRQRYRVYTEFRNKSRNIAFLFIGDANDINLIRVKRSGLMYYAEYFQAICFLLEHRFYGKSHPTENLSLENLQYLSTRQVLADSANFIKGMNKKYELSQNVKWIAFGASYAGSLAAWLRLKYPHFVHGAVTVGAPLLAKMNFEENKKILAEVIRNHSKKCVKAIKRGVEQAVSLLRTEEGRQSLHNLLALCEIKREITKNDIALLFLFIANNFNDISSLSDHNNNKYITKMCLIMTNESIAHEVERLAKVNSWILGGKKMKCLNYDFEHAMGLFRNENWGKGAISRSNRQWSYQLCREFGFFTTSDSKPQVFGDKFPLDFFVTKCQSAYDSLFNHDFIQNAVDNTNFFYGGKDIRVSNVVFVYGSLDPWKALGTTQTMDGSSTVIIINGYGETLGFKASTENDSLGLMVAREKIKKYIEYWLRI